MSTESTTTGTSRKARRERYAEVVTRWALMYPLGNYGIWGTAGASRDQLAGIAEDIAAGWGRDIAERVLAVRDEDLERLRGEVVFALDALRKGATGNCDDILTDLLETLGGGEQ